MKVVKADLDNDVVHARLKDGRVARITGLETPLPKRGEIILVDGYNWEHAPRETWQIVNSVATVREVLDSNKVLLDDGFNLKPIPNEDGIVLSPNNTVEYNQFEGIVKKISDAPIQSRNRNFEHADNSKEFQIDTSSDDLSFDNFGGYPDVVRRARELIEVQLNNRKYLQSIGAKPVKGILFTGPPGTGKTHLARIIAHSSKADFYLVSGPSIISKWLGDTENTLRNIFKAAAGSKLGQAIIFFDEIDSIGEHRKGDTHEASKKLVAQLLTLMDGFNNNDSSVIVIAATNRIETLDPALMRPGRFDWKIEIGYPAETDRYKILQVGSKKLQIEDDLPLREIATMTDGWAAADLSSLWSEAALVTAGDKRDRISGEDVIIAFERIRNQRASTASLGETK